MRWLGVLVAVGLGACRGSETEVTSQEGAIISDAVHHGGHPGVYFLPPLVEPTTLPPTFDATLTLSLAFGEIGQAPLRKSTLTVNAGAEHYSGKLDTSSLDLDGATTYRVHLLHRGAELAFADVVVHPDHHTARSLASDESFELVDGKDLVVKVYVNRCGTVTCEGDACHEAGVCDPLTGACSAGAATGWDCGRWDEVSFSQ